MQRDTDKKHQKSEIKGCSREMLCVKLTFRMQNSNLNAINKSQIGIIILQSDTIHKIWRKYSLQFVLEHKKLRHNHMQNVMLVTRHVHF